MSNPTFKFTSSNDGFARRVSFPSMPAWAELAGKLESLYGIPKGNVGISYRDTDGDEVVISSDEELQAYVKSNADENTRDAVEAMRFAVRNLNIFDAVEHVPLPTGSLVEGDVRMADEQAEIVQSAVEVESDEDEFMIIDKGKGKEKEVDVTTPDVTGNEGNRCTHHDTLATGDANQADRNVKDKQDVGDTSDISDTETIDTIEVVTDAAAEGRGASIVHVHVEAFTNPDPFSNVRGHHGRHSHHGHHEHRGRCGFMRGAFRHDPIAHGPYPHFGPMGPNVTTPSGPPPNHFMDAGVPPPSGPPPHFFMGHWMHRGRGGMRGRGGHGTHRGFNHMHMGSFPHGGPHRHHHHHHRHHGPHHHAHSGHHFEPGMPFPPPPPPPPFMHAFGHVHA